MDGIVMVMKYNGEELELVYGPTIDKNGNQFRVWRGKNRIPYPPDIAEKDAIFYIQVNDSKPYKFTLKDQIACEGKVLGIVVKPNRRREKAYLFIDEANKHIEE